MWFGLKSDLLSTSDLICSISRLVSFTVHFYGLFTFLVLLLSFPRSFPIRLSLHFLPKICPSLHRPILLFYKNSLSGCLVAYIIRETSFCLCSLNLLLLFQEHIDGAYTHSTSTEAKLDVKCGVNPSTPHYQLERLLQIFRGSALHSNLSFIITHSDLRLLTALVYFFTKLTRSRAFHHNRTKTTTPHM